MNHVVTLRQSVFRRLRATLVTFGSFGVIFLISTSVRCTAHTTITPTTTLATETGNNTSAADTFTTQNNGNAGAANVSKVSLRTLLYPGSTTKIYAHLLPWFGQPKHMQVGYNSDDPAQMTRQVTDMISRGVQGAIIDWYGPRSARSNQTALNLKVEAESRQGAFEFAIQEDAGALADAATQNGCDVTQQLISDLTYAANNFEGSPAYMRVNGRPVVFFFDVTKYYVDWNRVRAALPGNPLFVSRNPSGFAVPQSNGAFAWLSLNHQDPYDIGLSYLDDFYTAALNDTGQLAVGSVYKGFNDTLASWGTNRFMHQQCGKTWLASFVEIGKFYSATNQLPALQLVTWNDYEEGTEIETGIDSCLAVRPVVSAQTITWAIVPDPQRMQALGTLQVDESTVDHYTVFISSDGQNLMSLGDVPAGTHALDLSQFGFSAGNYMLYVKAVGKPSIQNKMSFPVSFNPADQPPVMSLSVSPNSGAVPLQVTASINGSSDPDGTIASSQIDFGDGTVLSGPTANHTYSSPGPYTVVASVTDNAGLTARAATTVNVAALAQPGVSIVSPQTGASLPPTVHVVANAVTQQPINSFAVQVDDNVVYRIASPHIDTNLKLSPGSHILLMQATDAAQQTVSATADITIQGTTSPPVAELGLSNLPDTSPNTVLACTAGSTGFISSSKIDFGDGTVQSGVAALHTYGDSQPHDVTATIQDVDGITSIATATAHPDGPDFGFVVSPANASIHAGQQAIIDLQITPGGGQLPTAVSLSCGSGLPAGAACNFSPTSVTAGKSPATSTLTISTTGTTALANLRSTYLHALWMGLPGLAFAGMRSTRRARKTTIIALVSFLLLLVAVQIGCGGAGSSGSGTQVQQSQPGTYQITVTASSGSVQHSVRVSLEIN